MGLPGQPGYFLLREQSLLAASGLAVPTVFSRKPVLILLSKKTHGSALLPPKPAAHHSLLLLRHPPSPLSEMQVS